MGKQIVATLKYPTIEEYEQYSQIGKPLNAMAMLENHVTNITNLTLDGKEIKDGVTLVKARRKVSRLADELVLQIISESEMEVEEEKNSEGQSSST